MFHLSFKGYVINQVYFYFCPTFENLSNIWLSIFVVLASKILCLVFILFIQGADNY
ncbi:hypothetical protein THF5G08_110175 [Vibrio jasicida]|nr:hypothetical protein THF5G08_110175 [Vibrio jasicida]